MSDVVIKIENLSKQYRLGVVGTGTISRDLNRWWARIRGKDDPTLCVTESNDRAHKGHSDFVWALKDIDLEVKQGEVLGIIGRNGAGKSTLLKILSRVTAPTTGTIKVKGRIASLLEVGTGFHPELTGRENVYLNGAIMGMSRKEVSAKLDEIVDFSGCERYIDTPVKRYSSGMTVRLGFAVAAHLEPEILVVDEVLAVGDIEFQKKCLGKMGEVASHGRTVLFVSHNMTAISSLCTKGVSLRNGKISEIGRATEVVDNYLKNLSNHNSGDLNVSGRKGNGSMRIKRIDINPKVPRSLRPFRVRFTIEHFEKVSREFEAAVSFRTMGGMRLFQLYSNHFDISLQTNQNKQVVVDVRCDNLPLAPGSYQIFLWVGLGKVSFDSIEEAMNLQVAGDSLGRDGVAMRQTSYPIIAKADWSVNK